MEKLSVHEKRLTDIRNLLDKLPIQKIQRILSNFYESGIDPKTFDKYDKKQIVRDEEKLAERERAIKSQAHEEVGFGLTEGDVQIVADVAEYLIFQGIDKQNWIPFCTAIKTSRFDDVMNGVDSVIEYHNEALAHIGLAVDVTFSKQKLMSKLQRSKREIDSGKLTKIDYFESEKSGHKGELRGIPRVVVCIDIQVIEDLLRTKSATNHPMRWSVLSQIKLQLDAMLEYSRTKNPAATPKLKMTQQLFSALYEGLDVEEQYDETGYDHNKRIENELERAVEEVFAI